MKFTLVPLLIRFAIVCLVALPLSAWAGMILATTEDDVMVYTGPGEQFRVLAILPAKAELKASNKIVSSKAGRYYHVIVNIDDKTKAAGFIPVNAPVKIGGEDIDEDELSKYGAVALINRAAQITYTSIRNQQSLWTIGYIRFLSPGFYIKGLAGQWLTTESSATVAAAEMGNDALLFGSVSGYVAYSLGLINGSLFTGSQSLNIFMNGSIGLRYNFEGFASFGLGATQVAAINQNASLVSTGLQLTMEIGL